MNTERARRTGPHAEELESRRLLAATITDGVLVGTGTSGPDVISVRRVLIDDVIVTVNGLGQTFDMDDFTGVRLEGLGGNDTFRMIDALLTPVARTTTVLGGDGNDTLDYSSRTSTINFFIDPTEMSVAGTPRVGMPVHRDEFDHVETIIGGAGDDTFQYAQQDVFAGGPVSSYELQGRGGIDVFQDLVWPNADAFGSVTMLGGAGNDRFLDQADPRFTREFFFGEADHDQAEFYRVNDGTLDGGLGLDTIHFRGSPADAQGAETGNLGDFDGFENATKQFGTLIGTDGPNLLEMFSAGTILGLGGNDSINGSSGDDRLEGGDGDDNILAFEGDDTLDGGDGFDTLHGGAGNNTLINGEINDPAAPPAAIIGGVLVARGSGFDDDISIRRHLTDNVIVTVNSTSTEFDMDDFTGVRLEGLGGNDSFNLIDPLVASGVIRNTTIVGGADNDTVSYASRTSAVAFRGYLNPDAATAVPFITATSGANVDRLLNDVETILGGGGNDTFEINNGLQFDGSAFVIPALRLEGRGGNDTLGAPFKMSATLVGGAGNDTLIVDEESNATVFGGDGEDDVRLFGRYIPAQVDGGTGTDRVTYFGQGGPVLDVFDLRAFASVEDATLVDAFPRTIVGTDGPNRIDASGDVGADTTLQGLGGNDTIISAAGDDLILGGAGDDSLTGGLGDDTLDGGTGTDTLDGGYGNDTLLNGEVTPGPGRISITNRVLTAEATWGAERLTVERTGFDDVIVRIEGLARQFDMDDFDGVLLRGNNGYDELLVLHPLTSPVVRKVTLEGGAGNDHLGGNDEDNVFRGGDGADILEGGAGRDALFGGAGNDQLSGGAGLDFLDGGDNDDFIDAGDSAAGDTVLGGSGLADSARVDAGDNVSGVEQLV